MSIRNTFPQQRPTLNLDFANSKTLDPRITFTRTSTATYVDEDGLIKSVDADVARFDHDPVTGECLGLLVEESRENLVNYSESFDSWTTGNVDVGINTTTAPDGTQNAESLIERDQNYSGGAYRRNNVTIGSAYSGQLSYSVFLKSAEVTTVGLIIDIPELGDPRANVNLTSSTTSGSGTNSTYKVESFLNGWKRVSVTSTNSLSDYTGTFAVAIYLNGYVGFDNTGNYGDKVYVWGAQLERGAFPTSYIPTSGSTVTRNPDNVSMTGDNFSDWYNQSEGTVFTTFKCDNWNSSNQYGKVFTINQAIFGVENNGFWIGNDADNSNTVRYRVRSGGINQFGPANLTRTSTTVKSAISVKSSDFAITIDGNTPSTSTSGTLPQVMNSLTIGRDIVGIEDKFLNGTISKLTYYPTRLSNDQLQNLTK